MIIIDGNHLAHRSRWAHNDLEYNGFKTGSIYGFRNSLFKIQRDFPNRKYIVVWDTKSKRKEIYSEYKANRIKDDDYFQFLKQIDVIKEICRYLNIDQYYAQGYEADDCAFELVERNKNDKEIILISGDMDWSAMVSNNVKMLKTPKNEWVDQQYIQNYFQGIISPKFIQLFKTLTGDSSDNIKGVPRIRKKLVAELCNQYEGDFYIFKENFKTNDLISLSFKDRITQCIDRLEVNYKIIGLMRVDHLEEIEKSNEADKLEKIYYTYGFHVDSFDEILNEVNL